MQHCQGSVKEVKGPLENLKFFFVCFLTILTMFFEVYFVLFEKSTHPFGKSNFSLFNLYENLNFSKLKYKIVGNNNTFNLI